MDDLAMHVGEAEVAWDHLVEIGGVQDDAFGIWLHRSAASCWGRDYVEDRAPQSVGRNHEQGKTLSRWSTGGLRWVSADLHASWTPSRPVRYRTVEWGGTPNFDVLVGWSRWSR